MRALGARRHASATSPSTAMSASGVHTKEAVLRRDEHLERVRRRPRHLARHEMGRADVTVQHDVRPGLRQIDDRGDDRAGDGAGRSPARAPHRVAVPASTGNRSPAPRRRRRPARAPSRGRPRERRAAPCRERSTSRGRAASRGETPPPRRRTSRAPWAARRTCRRRSGVPSQTISAARPSSIASAGHQRAMCRTMAAESSTLRKP